MHQYYTKSDLFIIFYNLAYFLNETERWDRPVLAICSIFFLLGSLFFKKYRSIIFFIFLIFTSSHILVDFPKSSNHLNLMLFINLFLLFNFLKRYKFKINNIEIILEDFVALRWSLIIVYFLTGFHKLNSDFLSPYSSCANWYHDKFIWFLTGNVFRPFPNFVYFLSPILVVFLEIIESIALLFKKTQLIALISFLLFHSYLSLGGFVDFAALAISIMVSFIPNKYINIINDLIQLKFLKWNFDRIQVTILLFIIIGFLYLIEYQYRILPTDNPNLIRFIQGFLFNILFIYILLPFIILAFKYKIITWDIENNFTKNMRINLFSLLIFLFGFQNYLGLSTAGTFSMFSNIQTEGGKSNHLILHNNPFEIFPYQKNLVHIIKFEPPYYDFTKKFSRLKEKKIPKLVFSEFLIHLRNSGIEEFDAEIYYKGKYHILKNVHLDKKWAPHKIPIERYFMNFRPVNNQNLKQCMW